MKTKPGFRAKVTKQRIERRDSTLAFISRLFEGEETKLIEENKEHLEELKPSWLEKVLTPIYEKILKNI